MRSKVKPALIALAVFAAIWLASWGLARALISELELQHRAHVRDQLFAFRTQLDNAVNLSLQLLGPLAARAALGLDARAAAAAFAERVAGVGAVLIESGGALHQVYPGAGDAVSIPATPALLAKLAAAARASAHTVISESVQAADGGSNVFAARALRNARSEHVGAVIVQLHPQTMLADAGILAAFTDIELGVREAGADMNVILGHPGLFYSDAEFARVRIANRDWELAALPRTGWGTGAATGERIRSLGFGLAAAFAIVVWVLFWFVRRPSWFGPALAAGAIVVVCGALAWLVQERDRVIDRTMLLRAATHVYHATRLRLDAHLRFQRSLTFAANDAADLGSAVEQAEYYQHSNPDVASIFVADLAAGVTRVLAGERAPHLAPVHARAAAHAAQRRRPVLTPAFADAGGARIVQSWAPWYEGAHAGFIVLQLNLPRLLQATAPGEYLREYSMQLVNSRGELLAAAGRDEDKRPTLRHQLALQAPGSDLALRMQGYANGRVDPGTWLLLALATGLTGGLFLAMWHLQRANARLEREVAARTARLRQANAELNEDIAQRKRVEGELRASETRFRGVFEQSNDAILIVDPRRETILDFNPRAIELLEYAREELAGMPVRAVHPGEMQLFAKFRQQVRERGCARSDELSCLTKSGNQVPVELSASNLSLGHETLLLMIARDLRERKRQQQALEEALQEVRQLKDRLQAENVYLRDEIRIQHNFKEIIGASKALHTVLKQIEDVAATDATVLILGETGTGKELVARAIHDLSARNARPLVKVNCAALPHELIESELFGHEKGAFTGASARKAGRFELADGGTIFLDEIGELPPVLQAKLLRVLQEGEFERLGATRSLRIDVRVIAATNRDLRKSVASGEFREDLYYRLNVFPICCPALRERREDIALLVPHFVRKYCSRSGKQVDNIPQMLIDELHAYDWPGNVRELENVIERAVIRTRGPTLALDKQLFRERVKQNRPPTLKEMEASMILEALEASNWVIEGRRGAASRLDIPPSTLRERMQRAGIKRPLAG